MALTDGGSLPEDSILQIRLTDVSRADVPSETVNEIWIVDPAPWPVSFAVPYDPDRLEEGNHYTLEVRIVAADGTLLYINSRSYDILTRGNPDRDVEVMLDPA